MSNVLIIPQMLSLSEEEQIKQNIVFFRDTIDLMDRNSIRICCYPEMLYLYQPPIKLDVIKDPGVKAQCKEINHLFVGKILKKRYEIDVEECGGTQDFSVNEAYRDDDLYKICQYLLINCYADRVGKERIDNRILCGKKADGGLLYHENLVIKCACESEGCKTFEYRFLWPKEFFDAKANAISELRDLYFRGKLCYNNSPELVLDGDHHVYFQDNPPSNYNKLTSANRSVLKNLQYFGLSRVHMHETHGGSRGMPGEIIVDEVFDPHDTNTCVNGVIRGENNTIVTVELQLPAGIGSLIINAIGRDWSIANIRKLRESIVA